MSACMATGFRLMNVLEWEVDTMKNRNFWLACTIEESGKFYAYAVKVSSSDNLTAILGRIAHLQAANIYGTKKQAAAVVQFWNDCYKQNGTYLFDTPGF